MDCYHSPDLMDTCPIEYLTESQQDFDTDTIESIPQAIEYARQMGFEISMEEFSDCEDPEEGFWEEFTNRCMQVEERCHPVWGW